MFGAARPSIYWEWGLPFSFGSFINYGMLCLVAVLLGIGAGAIDTAFNSYVAFHYISRHMSFLHCFYGIGVVASPYVLSMVMHGVGGTDTALCF